MSAIRPRADQHRSLKLQVVLRETPLGVQTADDPCQAVTGNTGAKANSSKDLSSSMDAECPSGLAAASQPWQHRSIIDEDEKGAAGAFRDPISAISCRALAWRLCRCTERTSRCQACRTQHENEQRLSRLDSTQLDSSLVDATQVTSTLLIGCLFPNTAQA